MYRYLLISIFVLVLKPSHHSSPPRTNAMGGTADRSLHEPLVHKSDNYTEVASCDSGSTVDSDAYLLNENPEFAITSTVCLLAAGACKFLISLHDSMTRRHKQILLILLLQMFYHRSCCVCFGNALYPSHIGICCIWYLLPQCIHSYHSSISNEMSN